MRNFIRAAALALSAGALIATGIATQSQAASRVSFTCEYEHVCFFQNDDWTGNDKDYTELEVLNNLYSWTEIPSGTRGSLTDNNTDYNMQVYAADTGAHQTVFSGSKVVLYGTFGWWCEGDWNTCNNHLPSVLRKSEAPGHILTKCDEKVRVQVFPDLPRPHETTTMRPNPNSCGVPVRARIGCAYNDGVPHAPSFTLYFAGSPNVFKRGQVSRAHCTQQPNLTEQFANWGGWQLKYGGKWHSVCTWRFHLQCPSIITRKGISSVQH